MGAAAVISGIGLGLDILGQRKARRQQAQAAAVEKRRAEVANARARRKAVAERLRASEQARSAAQAAGISAGTSAVQAEISSLGAQFGANVGFSSELEQLDLQRREAEEKVQQTIGKTATLKAGFSLASDVSSFIKPKPVK